MNILQAAEAMGHTPDPLTRAILTAHRPLDTAEAGRRMAEHEADVEALLPYVAAMLPILHRIRGRGVESIRCICDVDDLVTICRDLPTADWNAAEQIVERLADDHEAGDDLAYDIWRERD